MPTPSELEAYKNLDPALYDAIRDEFLANGAHRRQMEAEESRRVTGLVKTGATIEKWALIAGSVFSFAALGLGGFAMFTGRPVGGLVALLGVLPGVLAVLRTSGRGKKD